MAKQTFFRTERDLKTLNRMLKVGDKVYAVNDIETSMSPWEDQQLYSVYTVTGRSWIDQQWIVNGSSWTVATLVHQGGVYTEPPAGMRNMAAPGPQVAGPLPAGQEFGRDLDEAELARLEGRVAADRRQHRKDGRGLKGHKNKWF
ncbi:hypothetical protein ACIQZB_43560 [Streptomyces sp. NPDC097727]|uniref:hypothetical protein n=1 Tax=Streptomyces sp. NPDC097727 TaxID=3366092 RepID=UPI0038253691